jgi:large subunit ribosomal protein L4
MPTVKIVNTNGQEQGELELSDAVFSAEIKPHLHWEVVKMQRANKRQGTHATKTRSMVRGSGAKIYRQKGTGRARHGDKKAPQFKGGGVAHGPQPRKYTQRVPAKVRAAALRSAISTRTKANSLIVLDQWEMNAPKTGAAAGVLKKLGASNPLVVTAGENTNVHLSLRNLPEAKYIRAEGLNVFDVLKYDQLILTVDGAKALEKRLSA